MQISDNKIQPIPEPPLDLARIASPLKIKLAKMDEMRYPSRIINEVLEVPLSLLLLIFYQIKTSKTKHQFSVLLHRVWFECLFYEQYYF